MKTKEELEKIIRESTEKLEKKSVEAADKKKLMEQIIEESFKANLTLEQTVEKLQEAMPIGTKGFDSVDHIIRAMVAPMRNLDHKDKLRIKQALEEAERLGYRKGTGALD